MSCSNPIPVLDLGYKINEKGERVKHIKFLDMRHRYFGYGLDDLKNKFGDSLLLIPCGKCYLCSLDYARMWASRICLEAQFHEHNSFITLTFSDEWLKKRRSLKPSKRDMQLFIKKLRKEVDVPIRYFLCGEVGEHKGDREMNPHYHAIIFGYDFPDKTILKRSHSGMMIYRSTLLEKLWPYGMSSIGDVSPESAQYVAKYSMKKHLSGEDVGEFVLMSRRPGIGIKGYDPEDYMTDKLYLYGKKYKMPRYFDKISQKNNNFDYYIAKDKRIENSKNIASKKYFFELEREEFALDKLQEDKILNDSMKVRNI